MLELLTESPTPELLLLLGGILGVAVAILGNDRRGAIDNIARGLGFLVGGLLMAASALMLWDGIGATSTWLIGFLLGIALFFKVFRKVPVAVLLALIIGSLIGFFLYDAGFSIGLLVIVALVAMVIIYVLLRFAQFIANLIGRILGLRPVLLVLGVLGLIEAALLLSSGS